jgi:hypothetical protein
LRKAAPEAKADTGVSCPAQDDASMFVKVVFAGIFGDFDGCC